MTIGNQNAANTVARLSPEQRAELESAIAEINRLRGEINRLRGREVTDQWQADWQADWTTAHEKAAIALGTSINRGDRDNSWNELIDLLDAYRLDWRGYVVHSISGVAE